MDEKQSFWNRVRMAMTFQRMAIAEMVGRTEPIETMYKKVTARFGAYKDITTFDASRTTYALARAIFFANEYSDKRTGKTYGKDYLLGAPFGKPIVNIAASFALGSAPQIIENDTVVDEEDAPTESPGLESPGEAIELETSPTVRNVNQWLDEIYNDLWTVIRNSYRDGDAYLVMDDDGEITIMPPEDVDIITDPEDPDVIIGYDIWTSFADPKVPNDNITYVDEIRRSYRVRMKVDKNENRTEVPGTRFEYRSAEDGGLEERELPVVHFANEKEPRMLYGISEFQSLYYLFANYHAVLAAAIKNNIYNSGAVPVIQGVKKLKEFLDTNFDKDKDGNYRVKWDSDKMLIIGEGGSAQILQADGTASDADSLLNILFWLIAQNSETPEFAFGTAVRSSKASVSEQTPMLVKKSVRKQGQLSEPLRKLIDLYIQRMAVIRPEEFDAEITYTIDMPDILDDDLNINIQIVNTLLEKGIITEETAMVMLNVGKFVKDTALELKRAKQQKEARNPIPTDVFGQPITDGSRDKAERDRVAKQKEIDEMKKHQETKNVAEMLQKNMDVLELEQIIAFNPYHKDVVQETQKIPVKSGNPYRDSSGRFSTGGDRATTSDLNTFDYIPEKPVYYHGSPALAKIQEEGFNLDSVGKGSGGMGWLGRGVYLAFTRERASEYGKVGKFGIKAGLKLYHPKTMEEFTSMTQGKDTDFGSSIKITAKLKKLGFDGMVADGDAGEIVIFDPKNVIVPKNKKTVQETLIKVKSGNPYRQSDGRFGHAPSGDGELTPEEVKIAEKAFGTDDAYVYHLDATNADPSSFKKYGFKPSARGQFGKGVYLSNTKEGTQFYAKLNEGTLYRLRKLHLIERYGLYAAKAKGNLYRPDGLQFDRSDGQIFLEGNRAIKYERGFSIQVQLPSGGWRDLSWY